MRASTALLITVPMLLVTALFVSTLSRRVGEADPAADATYWDDALVRFVRQRIAATYVDDLDGKAQAEAFFRALDAYLDFDPYCDVIPPWEYRQWKEGMAGQYGGLGIRIDREPEGLRLKGLLPGGPAARAGLALGDLVVAADGRTLANMDASSDLAQRLLKGPPGSAVRLRVRSAAAPDAAPGAAPPAEREVVAVRQIVRPAGVFVRRVGPQARVGVVHVTEFAESTHDEFDAALNGLLAQGLDALVLDLRDNPGGALNGAVHLVDRFLAQGAIVRIEGRAKTATRVYSARAVPTGPSADVPDTLPLAVLVNGHSASASEVVAGALQDHRRALLVGERTFGKFLVQQITEAPRGDCAVQLVTSRYYTPLGRSYQRRMGSVRPDGSRGFQEAEDALGEPAGLLPDVVQALEPAERERLERLWANQEDRAWGAPPSSPDVPDDWVDPQLARALEALQGELVLRKIRDGGRSPVKNG